MIQALNLILLTASEVRLVMHGCRALAEQDFNRLRICVLH